MSETSKTTLTAEGTPKRRPSRREQEWEEKTLQPTLAKSPERLSEFTTISGYPIRRLYTQADLADWDGERDLGLPGDPPYTRGIHATMHRGRQYDETKIRDLRRVTTRDVASTLDQVA